MYTPPEKLNCPLGLLGRSWAPTRKENLSCSCWPRTVIFASRFAADVGITRVLEVGDLDAND